MNGNKLRGKIAEQRLSLEKVANSIGINPSTLYRKLEGKTEFSRDEIIKLANVLSLEDKDVMSIFFSDELAETHEDDA